MELIKSKAIILYVHFTNNNILCTITNLKGRILITDSVGFYKIKGLKKITSTTIFNLIKNLYKCVKTYKTLYLKIKGTNKNKTEFIKGLKMIGFNILLIQEKFSIPFGGCKNSKARKI